MRTKALLQKIRSLVKVMVTIEQLWAITHFERVKSACRILTAEYALLGDARYTKIPIHWTEARRMMDFVNTCQNNQRNTKLIVCHNYGLSCVCYDRSIFPIII